jgi:hypothetical protein
MCVPPFSSVLILMVCLHFLNGSPFERNKGLKIPGGLDRWMGKSWKWIYNLYIWYSHCIHKDASNRQFDPKKPIVMANGF